MNKDYSYLIIKAYDDLISELGVQDSKTKSKIQRINLLNKTLILKYYKSFKGYNANVKYTSNYFEFHLSENWKTISDEIQIGLIQSLLSKIYKIKKNTYYLELYDLFLRNVHVSIPKDNKDPVLLDSFERVNQEYFSGSLEECNLLWGKETIRKLGSYDYTSDVITISSIFKKLIPQKEYLLDYVMYHEMLHKKLKFSLQSGSDRKIKRHHTKEFKILEAKFLNSKNCEKELSRIGTLVRMQKNILGVVGLSSKNSNFKSKADNTINDDKRKPFLSRFF